MDELLRCPKCGSADIRLEHIYDHEATYIEDKNALINQCVGTCRHCGIEFQWEEVFVSIGFTNIQDISKTEI